MLAKERAEEEMRDLSDTVEMATLDKEMAEERVSLVPGHANIHLPPASDSSHSAKACKQRWKL